MEEINSTYAEDFTKGVNGIIGQEGFSLVQEIGFNAEIIPADSYDKIGFSASISTSKELQGQSIKTGALKFELISSYNPSEVEDFVREMNYVGYSLVQPIKHMELSVEGYDERGEITVYVAFIVYTTEGVAVPTTKAISVEHFETEATKENRVETENQKKARKALEIFGEADDSDDDSY